MVKQFRSLIAADVQSDTRKIFSTSSFTKSVTEDNFEPGFGPTASSMSLKTFFEQHRAFVLKDPGIKLVDK